MLRVVVRLHAVGLAVAFLTLACTPPAGQAGASGEVFRAVSRGVFEVVVPMPDDGTTTYKSPLPFDLLPVWIRNQKLLPVGTAFAISPTQFVTAAHVLLAAPGPSVYLRDAAGATYEISRIVRFSEYRDIAVVELVRPAAHVAPLQTRTSVALGETVLTVGDAGGQGIVAREGVVTSFTPEEVEGRWRFIRFTAPASPGNSGGPLVDAAGHAVGIVLRKSAAENLNYAIPIDELRNLRADEGDLSKRGLTIREDNQELRVDWSFHPHLPISLGALEEEARRSFGESMTRWYAEFDAKFGSVTFPNDPRLKTYLLEPDVPIGLGEFRVDNNGAWSVLHRGRYTKIEVRPGQEAFFLDGPDASSGQLVFDRPTDMTLEAWFQSPKALADAVIRNYAWTIPFAGRSIRIESLGAPADSERWLDEYGRPWFTYVWRLNRTAESVVFDCLTNPSGWACNWRRIPSAYEPAARFAAKREARRVTLSYWGRVRDWIDFLALPDAYKPVVLKGATVRLDDGLTLKLGPLAGERIALPFLSADSGIYAYVSLDPRAPHVQRIYEATLNPRIVNTYSFGVREVLAPTPERPAFEAALWSKLRAGIAPFDNVPFVETKTMNAMKRGVTPAGGGEGDRIDLEFCRNPVATPTAALEAACARFESALRP